MHHQAIMRNHTRHRAEYDHAMQCNLLGVNPAALPYCTLPGKCLTCISYRVFFAHPLSFPNYLQASYGGFWNLPSIVLVAKQEATLVRRCFFQPFCSCVGSPLLPLSPRSRPVLQILSFSPSITPHSYHVLAVQDVAVDSNCLPELHTENYFHTRLCDVLTQGVHYPRALTESQVPALY